MRRKPWWAIVLAALLTVSVINGRPLAASEPKGTKAKYLFLFIGDGMAVAQRNAAVAKGPRHPTSLDHLPYTRYY